MKLAIMQPYLMPFIGYFQLINTVDKFIFYDDVSFIKQGWINRNQILINNQASMFSVPLANASSHTLIKDVLISNNKFEKWRRSFLNSIMCSYEKAKNYENVRELIEVILDDTPDTISELAIKSIIKVSDYLELKTEFEICSQFHANTQLSGQNRVLNICKRESVDIYINPIGGRSLYCEQEFLNSDVKLSFIKTHKTIYSQFSAEFVPFLSIIDVLMFNDKECIMQQLNNFELV